MKRLCLLAAIFALACSTQRVLAHEFWISPRTYAIPPGNAIQADLRTGDDFSGNAFPFFPPGFDRFQVVMGEKVTDITGRMGDLPAVNHIPESEGLAILVHMTTPDIAIYRDWEKFEKFILRKASAGILAQHTARGLPKTGFVETYRRFAKSLVAVGHGRGQDRPLGLEIEITALQNPYTVPPGQEVGFAVTYQGKPRAGAKVELFERNPDGTVTVTPRRTDTTGVITIHVKQGTEYLIDAVVIRPVDTPPDEPGKCTPVWESLWATLTFKVPLEHK